MYADALNKNFVYGKFKDARNCNENDWKVSDLIN